MPQYTIQNGDTLRGIAQKFYGQESKWRVIWEANRATLRSGDPDLIYPGELLNVPNLEPKPIAPTPVSPAVDRSGMSERELNEVQLYVNNTIYAGWLKARVTRSIETAAASFSLEITEKWPNSEDAWPIFRGDECNVTIGPDPVITGYVDDIEIDLQKDARRITVTGRDKTEDAVDCSATNRPGEWRGKKNEQIAEDLCSPLGIKIKAEVPTGGVIDRFKLQPGETVYEALERMARIKGFLISSNATGELRITAASNTLLDVKLQEGVNILQVRAKYTTKDRYSTYTVVGQSGGRGRTAREAASGSKGVYSDESIKRNRPLLIVAENPLSPSDAQKRAYWEATVRAARSSVVNVTVQGWRMPNGDLWESNKLVYVIAPSVRVDRELLITDVEYTIDDDGGRITVMELKRPDAFLPEPQTDKKIKDKDEPFKKRNKPKGKKRPKSRSGGVQVAQASSTGPDSGGAIA